MIHTERGLDFSPCADHSEFNIYEINHEISSIFFSGVWFF